MNNSNQRLHDVFFYGLYMDENILKSKNVEIRNKRVALAKNYELRIGGGSLITAGLITATIQRTSNS